jgi:hypothetical protein
MRNCYMCGGPALNTNERRQAFEHLDQCPDSPARAPEWPSLFPGRTPAATPSPPDTKPATQWRAFGGTPGKSRAQQRYEAESLSLENPTPWAALDYSIKAAWADDE